MIDSWNSKVGPKGRLSRAWFLFAHSVYNIATFLSLLSVFSFLPEQKLQLESSPSCELKKKTLTLTGFNLHRKDKRVDEKQQKMNHDSQSEGRIRLSSGTPGTGPAEPWPSGGCHRDRSHCRGQQREHITNEIITVINLQLIYWHHRHHRHQHSITSDLWLHPWKKKKPKTHRASSPQLWPKFLSSLEF